MIGAVFLVILWTIMYGYMIAASIDFGMGFYLFYGQYLGHEGRFYAPLQRWLSPTSEFMNIGFVLIFAAVIGFSPEILLNFQTPLIFCGGLAIVLIVVKGTFFALAELLPRGSTASRVFSSGNGIIGIFIPVVLSIVLVISEGGFADYGTGAFYAFVRSLTFNVYFWSVVLIAVVSIFYISAMYLVQFAWKMGNEPLTEHFRNYALFLSMPTVLASGVVFLGLESQNPEHFSAALDGLWPFVLSLICLLAAVTLVFLRKYPWTFLFVMLQYFFALYGYTVSHFPYLVYPDIVLNSGLSNWAKSAWFFVFSLVISIGTLVCYLRIRCWNVADQKHHE
ncbi:cytochrome d ubiquinol oxidase subunit II [Sporolactobacillus inulinus]|uniref:Cytochrome d ubiquinol oxidase subunit II n=2 Tax=Sporolactobacillus inulinus TaxID=2078 RepID=A0A4Y1ZIG3_9BACL|nr:cytochrome d ubiquinol oxidase subunit II [Sporolactobacillus inulinus]KLI01761.1 hypothetical protein SINU_11690 [Sporolactobacillus inulinus CASD]GAY78875.1 cytochrome d ubiquinol oxidase subunit II [Sporolactobacillus inulinus]GEB78134.1 cytochrome D ubiquinol oxidase subunit II [Sporolactobacillus inulinus]